MLALLSLTVLTLSSSALECISFTCGKLASGICASFEDDVQTINEDGCGSDLVCPVSDSRTYFRENGEGTYPCVDKDSFTDIIEELEAYEDEIEGNWVDSPDCVMDTGYDLASGSYPKECDDNNDCEFKNGEFGTCGCGLSGKSYCLPNFQSSFMEEWYELCESGEANLEYYKYFGSFYVFYVYELTMDDKDDTSCFEDVAYESAILEKVKQDYEDMVDDGALKLLLASAMGLLLLA
jgi:hypothetical protein